MAEPASVSGERGSPGWQDFGLPGLFDVHVHFLPPAIQQAVWREFDAGGEKIGREWPIRYRGSVEERVEQLRGFGVRWFSALPYAHRPGVAAFLNDWAADFAAQTPDCLRSATFYPEPGVGAQVADLVADGVELFKLHSQVGEYFLDDPGFESAWSVLEESGTPIVIHVGSGPVGNAFTGPQYLERLLRMHSRLQVIVAHLGAPEVHEFFELAEQYPRVHLDTAMVGTDFFGAFTPDLYPRFVRLRDRILYGSDFPSIPYDYGHQFEVLARLVGQYPGLDEQWVRDVCWHNAARLFGRDET